jgi:hypothetical protein
LLILRINRLAALPERTSYILICPKCLTVGSVTWDAPVESPGDAGRTLVHVGGAFHAQPGGEGRTRIACDGCNTLQPD